MTTEPNLYESLDEAMACATVTAPAASFRVRMGIALNAHHHNETIPDAIRRMRAMGWDECAGIAAAMADQWGSAA